MKMDFTKEWLMNNFDPDMPEPTAGAPFSKLQYRIIKLLSLGDFGRDEIRQTLNYDYGKDEIHSAIDSLAQLKVINCFSEFKTDNKFRLGEYVPHPSQKDASETKTAIFMLANELIEAATEFGFANGSDQFSRKECNERQEILDRRHQAFKDFVTGMFA